MDAVRSDHSAGGGRLRGDLRELASPVPLMKPEDRAAEDLALFFLEANFSHAADVAALVEGKA